MNYIWNSRPPVTYQGLRNQGATCYLNSVLQVLFMTDDFREAVERYPGRERIDLELRNLFGKLSTQIGNTYDITNKLGIRQVYEQQDAAEYYEKILNLTSCEASQIFHGKLTHRTICSACCTHTDTDGQFWHLPLTLVDSCGEYSVVNGIEDYFRASTFSGENQMYCEQCDDKRDATIQCVIKHHPEVLMLLLKRFQLDYYSMTYFKINRTVLIPYTIHIPENQMYELYAVVDHVGDLRRGHYSACIKSQEGRWFKFDDARVTEIDFQPFQSVNFERSDSAYLLFYRKKSAPAADTQTPEDIREEESAPGGCSPSTSDVDESQEAVVVNGGEKVEETEEAGIDIEVVDKHSVSVSSEEEVKPPEPRGNVDDPENRDYSMQGNHEEKNESNDSQLQLQDREKDETKTAPDDVEAEKKEDISRESLHEGSDENQDHESKKQNVKKIRDVCPQEVRVDVQIENEGTRVKERDEKRERRGKRQRQDSEEKDEVRQGTRVDPEGRQEGGEDTEPYRDVKQGGEKGGFTAASKVKSGADEVEPRSGKPLAKLDPVTKDDRVSKQGRRSRYESREQPREENIDILRDKEQKRRDDTHSQKGRVTDTRSSDGNGQERAQSKAAETQVKRRHSERAQDRDRSSPSRASLVRSRSLTKDQGEVRKGEKKVESEEGIVKDKPHSKEKGTGTPSGLEEITLETPPSGTRHLSRIFCGLTLHSRSRKRKLSPETETPEQAPVVKHKKKNEPWYRSLAKKRSKDEKKHSKDKKKRSKDKKKRSKDKKKCSKDKKKRSKDKKKCSKDKKKRSKDEKKQGESTSCFSFLWRNQSSELD